MTFDWLDFVFMMRLLLLNGHCVVSENAPPYEKSVNAGEAKEGSA
jgi:hypothetical protein